MDNGNNKKKKKKKKENSHVGSSPKVVLANALRKRYQGLAEMVEI
jgi:hypothetical protein